MRAAGRADAESGVFEGCVDRGWWVVRGPNGGYVAALLRGELPRSGARLEDWCLAVFRSRLAAGGFVEGDGEVWSRDDALRAPSRQLAVIG